MRTRRIKSLVAIALLAAILLAGCDSLPGRPTQADLPLRPSDVTDFATLYGENCAGCHGADGKFGAALAMNNPVYLAIVDDASMRRVIADGVMGTAMPPFAQSAGGSLTDRQIDLLIAGIRKTWAGAPERPRAPRLIPVPRRAIRIVAPRCMRRTASRVMGPTAKADPPPVLSSIPPTLRSSATSTCARL